MEVVIMTTTELNKNTQRAKAWIDSYFQSSCFSVRDFYSSRVYRKESIEDAIKSRMRDEGLKDYRIVSGNGFYFTCGYMDETENILYIETAYNIFEIDLR